MKQISKKLFFFGVIALTLFFAGCASQTHEIETAHVSTVGYKNFTCKQLHAEMQGNINRVNDLTNILTDLADDDEAATAIGMILFWPALFALEGGDGVEAAEYSRLKGEINAMEQVAIMNDCPQVIELAQKYHDAENKARLQREKIKAEQQSWGGYEH